jgi:hypothetical protein
METVLDYQYLQSALVTWRSKNHWADDIEFRNFPERYRDEIILAAQLLQFRSL